MRTILIRGALLLFGCAAAAAAGLRTQTPIPVLEEPPLASASAGLFEVEIRNSTLRAVGR